MLETTLNLVEDELLQKMKTAGNSKQESVSRLLSSTVKPDPAIFTAKAFPEPDKSFHEPASKELIMIDFHFTLVYYASQNKLHQLRR